VSPGPCGKYINPPPFASFLFHWHPSFPVQNQKVQQLYRCLFSLLSSLRHQKHHLCVLMRQMPSPPKPQTRHHYGQHLCAPLPRSSLHPKANTSLPYDFPSRSSNSKNHSETTPCWRGAASPLRTLLPVDLGSAPVLITKYYYQLPNDSGAARKNKECSSCPRRCVKTFYARPME
jgi:hypothetical protein